MVELIKEQWRYLTRHSRQVRDEAAEGVICQLASRAWFGEEVEQKKRYSEGGRSGDEEGERWKTEDRIQRKVKGSSLSRTRLGWLGGRFAESQKEDEVMCRVTNEASLRALAAPFAMVMLEVAENEMGWNKSAKHFENCSNRWLERDEFGAKMGAAMCGVRLLGKALHVAQSSSPRSQGPTGLESQLVVDGTADDLHGGFQ